MIVSILACVTLIGVLGCWLLRRRNRRRNRLLHLSRDEISGRDLAIEYRRLYGPISYGTLYTDMRALSAGLCPRITAKDRVRGDCVVRYFKIAPEGRIVLLEANALDWDLADREVTP